jgi:hypothetical protein
MEAMQPEFEDETPINPFDFWQGANFKLKIVKKDGYWNYDKSEFDRVAPLLDDDDALEALWKKEYSLTAITAPDQFKSYEELERRMNAVLGLKNSSPARSRAVVEQEDDLEEFTQTPTVQDRVVEELEQSYARSKSSSLPQISQDDDEDDAMAYFSRLAND